MRRRWTAAIPIAAVVVIALLVPILPLADPLHIDVAHQLARPSASHLLGQDEYGRDVLSRLLWGARVTLAVSLAASLLACIGGVVLGLVGGTLRGLAELLMVRSMDVVLCFPPLLLLWPCLALVFTIFAMNLLCDAVRDAMEPHAAPIISPQDAAGGTTPRPRNDSPDSSTMAEAAVRLSCTMIGPATLGRMVRHMMRNGPPPRTRIASTKSAVRRLSTRA
jgi:hypothetical protein